MFAKCSRIFSVCIFIISSLCVVNTAAVAETKPVLNIQTWQTSNGVPVYFVQAKELPMVDVQVLFNAGSAQDREKLGIAKFVNSMLNEGTATLNADQIAEQFDNLGAGFSASVSRDMALVGLRSLSDPKFFNPALQTFINVLTTANFPNDAFSRVQKQILISLEQQKQSPAILASKAFFKALYDDQAYGHAVLGSTETVNKMTPTDLKDFYQRNYVAKNAMIAIVGDLDKTSAMSVAEQIAKPLPSGQAAPSIAPPPTVTTPVLQHIPFPASQTTILIGQVGITPNDLDYFPLMVGNYTLGGSDLVSRLFQQVRNKRGLAYSINSYFYPLAARGPFVLGLQSRKDQSQNALAVAHETFEDFVKTGPTQEELDAAKKNIIGSFPLGLASNADILSQVINIGFYRLPLNYLDTYRDKVNAVTTAQVREAFQKHINLNALVTITVGGEVKQDVKTAENP